MAYTRKQRNAPNNNKKPSTRSQQNVEAAEDAEETEETEEVEQMKEKMREKEEEIAELKVKLDSLQKSLDQNATTSTTAVAIEPKLNQAETANLSHFVNKDMFRILPLANDATFTATPKLIDGCLDRLNITDPTERLAKRSAVEKKFKDCCSNKRSYIQRKLSEKYKGK